MNFYYSGGLLDKNTEDGVRSLAKSYPFFLEVKGNFPIADFVNFTNQQLPKHRIMIESGSSGEYYESEPRALWGIMWKNGALANGAFIGFQTAAERAQTALAFRDWIVDTEPFKTTIELP